MIESGREFFKMTGSGNDFVVVDARAMPPGDLTDPAEIGAICARGVGVGADGVVFLEPSREAAFRMAYYNSDGSRASMCGNAALCCTRLAVELGAASASGFTFETDSGVIHARMRGDRPEVDLSAVSEVRADMDLPRQQGEQRIGFARAGVPHLTILVNDTGSAPVVERGRELRWHRSLRDGANVNFVARRPGGGWAMRTYERGVEAETLACGTGAVASALLLRQWGDSSDPIRLATRSGRTLEVRLRKEGDGWHPSLSGEGRIVFRGSLVEPAPGR